jgi:thiol-disulfide isomerase/thioredoxin
MILLQRRLLLAAGATLASAPFGRKPQAAAGAGPLPDASKVKPTPGAPLPEFSFRQADGAERTLADYAGHGVVLNLWATWCVPCVAEMPSLDALAEAVAGAGVMVLPLSSDRGGAAAVERFYAERGVKHLPVLLDPRGAAARALGAVGIPTTLLIDAGGRERGRLEGGADWASAGSIAMVKALARPG